MTITLTDPRGALHVVPLTDEGLVNLAHDQLAGYAAGPSATVALSPGDLAHLVDYVERRPLFPSTQTERGVVLSFRKGRLSFEAETGAPDA